jgi:hypothetical protein
MKEERGATLKIATLAILMTMGRLDARTPLPAGATVDKVASPNSARKGS